MRSGYDIATGLCIMGSVLTANAVTPIDLRSSSNMGFRDEVAMDGKGGWTDQGNNDLRLLPLGRQKFCGVEFNIIDPSANGGKSCIVLRGAERPAFPLSAEVATNAKGKFLYLLHAAAFSAAGKKKCGDIKITYADGSSERLIIDWTCVGN